MLSKHPEFEIHALGASSRSAGKAYKDAVSWKQTDILPESAQNIVVQTCEPEGNFKECDIVFSGLDSDVAGEVEKKFVEAGLAVVSNAKTTEGRQTFHWLFQL